MAEVGKSTDGAVDIASSQHPLNSFAPDESVVIQGYVGARARPPNERAYPARANGGGSGLGELWVASAFDHRIGTASKLIAEQIGQLGRVFNRERIGPELAAHAVDWHMLQAVFDDDLDPERLARSRAREREGRA